MLRSRTLRLPLLAAVLAAAAACGGTSADAAPAGAERPPTHVDSIVPIDVALDRFRSGLRPTDSLAGGAASRDALVERWVAAVERADTAAIAGLQLDGAEFAWLYFPHTRHTRPPYEMDPALLWFLMQQNGEKGITRVLRRHGGRPLGYAGYECGAEPVVEERNRIWNSCTIRFRPAAADSLVERRLFGSIIERDGRFKFVSYANDL